MIRQGLTEINTANLRCKGIRYAYGHKYLKGQDQKRLMLIYPKTERFLEPLPAFHYEDGFRLDAVPFDVEKGALVVGDYCYK